MSSFNNIIEQLACTYFQ